jgi:ABC-type uncharacterized transport system involved in gliding motility auxiliary subunit
MRKFLRQGDIAGLVLILLTIGIYRIRGVWEIYHWIVVGLAAALIIASLVIKSSEIKAGLGRRSTKFGINSATSVLLIVGVLALVNYLGAQHQKRFDVTTTRLYSLSDESVKVAQQVNQDLHIKAFYPGGEYQPAKDLLDLFRGQNSKINYEFIDPDKQPQTAQQFQVTAYGDFQNPMTGESFRYGTLVFQMGDKTERIEKQNEPLREEDMTNTLTRIVKGAKKTIYFTTGHGERNLDDTERTGLNQARGDLEKESYLIKPVNLVTENKVPDDASVLVIAGPTAEFFPQELEMVDTFLKNGGSVLTMLDPPPAAALKDLMTKWSVDVGNNIVLDISGMGRLLGMGPAAPLVNSYGQHAITERMRLMTFFPLARSVSPATPPVEGITVDKLLNTNDRSWGETDTKSGEAQFNEGKDLKGPVTIAVAVSKDAGDNKKSRMVVYGDSDFATNASYAQAGNGNLFTNTVNWLARDENFISIKPKSQDDRRLEMTEAQGRLVSYVVLILLPVGVLITGISVWMKRRK